MFTCSHCHKLNLIRSVDRDAGEYIAICRHCQAKNILAVTRINHTLVPMIETRGCFD
jgi:hypothetical protein